MTQPKIDHLEAVRPSTDPNPSIVQTTLDGVPVFRFTVKPGDVQEWDRGEGNRGGNGQFNERAEISYAPAPDTQKYTSPVNVKEGMLQKYDVGYWFEPGFPTHDPAQHAWAVLTQFHEQPGHKGIPGFGGATIRGDSITYYNPSGDGGWFAQIPIKKDRTRISVLMEVKWASDVSGWAKILDRASGALYGSYSGPTIAPGEFKYLKQGYYRAGGLPQGTVYQTQIDISPVDLTAPTSKKNSAPLDPTKPSVQPNDGAATLMTIRDQLVKLGDSRVQPQIDAVNKLLDAGAWTP